MTDNTTPAPSTSEALSPAEMAYFNSGGTDTSGLGSDYVAPSTPDPTPSPILDLETAPKDEEAGDDDVTVGADGKPRDASGKFVPHAALHKEREGHKATKAELQAAREMMARADERLNVLNELMKGNPAPNGKPKADAEDGGGDQRAKSVLDEEPIDPEQDIFAAFKQVQRINAELARQMREGESKKQQQTQIETLKGEYQRDATAFMAKAPDFKDAYSHLIGAMHRELEFMGVNDEGQRNRLIAEKESEFVKAAIAQKRSPSEAIYQLSKIRGYAGAAPQPTQQQVQQPTAAERIGNVKRGQQAVFSLASAGGTSGEGLTKEVIANMSEADFARVTKQLSKSQMRDLMGG